MRNRLLVGVSMSALAMAAAAAPASAQVRVQAQVSVQRSQPEPSWDSRPVDDEDYDEDEFEDDAVGSAYGPYRPAGFGIQIYGGGSANEYGPYGYAERGYGRYSEWGNRGRSRSPLRAAFDFGRRDGYEAGLDAGRYGRFEPRGHSYYRSTRGWNNRYGARDAYDVNYRNGFRSGYDQGFRDARRGRRW